MKIEEIFEVVKEVSETKVDNPHIWHDIIKIVSNMPNRMISEELLEYVPIWLSSSFRNSFSSHAISEDLLPKFLNKNASEEDLEKAEIILKHILDLREEKTSTSVYSGYIEKKYKPLIDLYWLRHTLIEKNLLELIGEKLSIGIIYKLADNLRKILYGQVVGKNLSSKFFLRFDIEDKNLTVNYDPDPNTELSNAVTVVINDFQRYEYDKLGAQIVEKIKGESSGIEIELDAIVNFAKRLFTDYSSIWCTSLHKLKEGEIMRDETKMLHVHLLMELTRIKAEFDEKAFFEIRNKIPGNEYPQPIFKRILFYAISKTWSQNKDIFWELVKKEDKAQFFSNPLMKKEIFYLLRENIKSFSETERNKLKKIIENGPQGVRISEGEDDTKYWQLQWYSALKDDPEFSENYKALSDEINLDAEHYETLGEVRISSGAVSPFKAEEIIDMGVPQLLVEIENFSPTGSFDSPSYDGFGNAIMSAVTQKPNSFTDELDLLLKAPFFCVYNFLLGFEKAWADKKPFEWEKLLKFINDYINSDLFKENKLTVKGDRLNMNNDLIIHQTGRLIAEGTKKDSNAFDAEYLPLAKKILQKIVPELEPVYDIDESNMNYPTYSLNSKAGKVLMALINYSLRYARVHYGEDYEGTRWKDDIKKLYEGALNKEIIDAYILIGFYFRQFNYLDKKWLKEKVKDFENLSEKEWKAFMGGYLFDYPARDQETYKLMYPHYKKAIDRDAKFGDFGYSSTVNHIAAFYLWEIESLKEGDLITELVSKGKSEDLSRLANFFWEVNDQIISKQREEIRPKILELWQRIYEKIEGSELEENEKVLSNLSKFMKYFEKLDDDIALLIKASAPYVNHDFNVPFFLEELNRLKDYNNSVNTAKHIGEIFKLMLKNFTPDYQESDIKKLVTYIYQFKEKEELQELGDTICAEYARRGKEFLRDLFKRNRE